MFAHRINTRCSEAAVVRHEASRLADEFEFPLPVNNGEEASYRRGGQPSYVANYSKGLRHNGFGEVSGPRMTRFFVPLTVVILGCSSKSRLVGRAA
jgi:hypothetical protein